MKKYSAAFASVTHANKAKSAFAAKGFSAEVRRTPRTTASGCGYIVIVEASPEDILSILDENGFQSLSISEYRGGR